MKPYQTPTISCYRISETTVLCASVAGGGSQGAARIPQRL